jgi:hypothetical protein
MIVYHINIWDYNIYINVSYIHNPCIIFIHILKIIPPCIHRTHTENARPNPWRVSSRPLFVSGGSWKSAMVGPRKMEELLSKNGCL